MTRRPDRAVLLFDFDGTLSAIVDDPACAVPRPGVVERLTSLVGRYRQVAVISGRPVDFLASRLPAGVVLSGLYGLESSDGEGTVLTDATAGRWVAKVAAAVAAARHAVGADPLLDGVEIEDKRLSMTIHHRRSPGAEGAVQSLASRLSDVHELWLRPARMSFELHPPVTVDKGTAVHALTSAVEEVESVLFAGDDVGDLAAFASVGELGERGLRTVRVAVVSAETDPRVVDASDLSIDEDEVMTLLDALLAEDRRPEEEVSGG